MRVCICSYKKIISESRVLRQARSFLKKGWQVTLAGFAEPGDRIEGVQILPIPKVAPNKVRAVMYTLCKAGLSAPLAWRQYSQNQFAEYAVNNCKDKFDFIIGHDWECAPLVYEYALKRKIYYALDIHEYAKEQHCPQGDLLRDAKAKYIDAPYIDKIQKKYFKSALGITTVCDGISELLTKDYELSSAPSVVRSVPFYESMPYRSCGQKIRILYHGGIAPSRRLDILIQSVKLLDDQYEAEIRGPADPPYLAYLKQLVRTLGVEDRVFFTESVPYVKIVAAANAADIGYEVVNAFSPQHLHMLPNKFFENTMAGLALCVSDFPEMAKIIKQYGHGICIPSCDPAEVAAVLNNLTVDRINEMKHASLEAAKDLCWEREEERMFAAYKIG